MGEKKKAGAMFIRLVSAAGTVFFYVKKKNPRKIPTKLEFRKYDPPPASHSPTLLRPFTSHHRNKTLAPTLSHRRLLSPNPVSAIDDFTGQWTMGFIGSGTTITLGAVYSAKNVAERIYEAAPNVYDRLIAAADLSKLGALPMKKNVAMASCWRKNSNGLVGNRQENGSNQRRRYEIFVGSQFT